MGARLICPVSAFAAAGIVGAWEVDAARGVATLDPAASAFLHNDERFAGIPLPVEKAFRLIHEEDRARITDYCRKVFAHGGPAQAEFKLADPEGGYRWVQVRGDLAWSEAGRMMGRGVFIDITEHVDLAGNPVPAVPVHVAPSQLNAVPSEPVGDPLAEAAELAVELRSVLGRSGHGALRLAADLLLWEINTALAARHTISDKPVPGLSKPSR
jgi:hypothetical protein